MKRTPKVVVMLFCIASPRLKWGLGLQRYAAFSSLSTSLASKLKDPSLVPSLVRSDGDSHGETFGVYDPGASARQFKDGSALIGKVRRMGRGDAKNAIERANSALSDWKDGTTASHRSAVLSKWSSLIKENADDIGKFCFIA